MQAKGLEVSTSVAIAVDETFARAALETILKEFAGDSQRASLALDVREMHVPLEAMLSVPVEAGVSAGDARNEWRLSIRAASAPALYPTFAGILSLIPAGRGCQLQLAGEYAPPFGGLGQALDATLLRGAARTSLRRFVEDIAHRVAAIARWTRG